MGLGEPTELMNDTLYSGLKTQKTPLYLLNKSCLWSSSLISLKEMPTCFELLFIFDISQNLVGPEIVISLKQTSETRPNQPNYFV